MVAPATRIIRFSFLFSILIIAVLAFTGCAKSNVVIKGISDLDGLKIGVQAGTTGEAWVQENVKDVKLSSFKAGIDAALDLKTGSIDCVVLDELPAAAVVSKILILQS